MKEFISGVLAATFLCSIVVSVQSSHLGPKFHQSSKQIRQAPKATKHDKRSINTGLSSTNLNVNGIAVGFLPALSEPIQPNTPLDINRRIGAPMSVVSLKHMHRF
jgi:hypothetical protein